jgi:hypothetical protein
MGGNRLFVTGQSRSCKAPLDLPGDGLIAAIAEVHGFAVEDMS